MTIGGRRHPNDTARLKEEALHDAENSGADEDEHSSHKRRRPWKDEGRRQDKQSKKQRQRNPEWND